MADLKTGQFEKDADLSSSHDSLKAVEIERVTAALNEIPDPDVGKSEAERKELVHRSRGVDEKCPFAKSCHRTAV